MKKDIHPTYYPEAVITCSCGNVLPIGSTKEEITIEVCSSCHPFYTGKQKVIDTAGRVEKFEAAVRKKEELQSVRSYRTKKEKRSARSAKKTDGKTAKIEAKAALKAAKEALSGLS